jgi:hypothetical protein
MGTHIKNLNLQLQGMVVPGIFAVQGGEDVKTIPPPF